MLIPITLPLQPAVAADFEISAPADAAELSAVESVQWVSTAGNETETQVETWFIEKQ